MNCYLCVLFFLIPFFCIAQQGAGIEKPEKKIHVQDDFAYTLPYEKGKRHFLVQGYKTFMSHYGEYALDFKMKKGTKICAARGGVVIDVKEDSHVGGIKKKHLSQGNHIIIRHEDGTFANYWHLLFDGVLVQVGDIVQQGQIIGLSGNTGFTAFPHLHFEVTLTPSPGQNQIPTKFHTKKGIRYLKTFRWHKSV